MVVILQHLPLALASECTWLCLLGAIPRGRGNSECRRFSSLAGYGVGGGEPTSFSFGLKRPLPLVYGLRKGLHQCAVWATQVRITSLYLPGLSKGPAAWLEGRKLDPWVPSAEADCVAAREAGGRACRPEVNGTPGGARGHRLVCLTPTWSSRAPCLTHDGPVSQILSLSFSSSTVYTGNAEFEFVPEE